MKKRFVLSCLLLLVLTGCGDNESRHHNRRYPDVSETISEAESILSYTDYHRALEKYLQALEQNPKSVDALIGAAGCQIRLGNYEVAGYDLDTARLLAPDDERLPELYRELEYASDPLY